MLVEMNSEMISGSYDIPAELSGLRLDAALAALLPGISLRELRRLWGEYRVELNHKSARKGVTVKAGDVVRLTYLQEGGGLSESSGSACAASVGSGGSIAPAAIDAGGSTGFPSPDLSCLRLLQQQNNILAIFKPAGLHSAALPGGRGGLSLEELLPDLCRELQLEPAEVSLFNRLDCLTTGIVLACQGRKALEECLAAEVTGQMEKRYLALVNGLVQGQFTIKNKLDTDSRIKTKALQQEDSDPLRHTQVEALYSAPAEEFGLAAPCLADCTAGGETPPEGKHPGSVCTLVQVGIRRGARHQIRAHLAAAGYPVWGDPLYNPFFPDSQNLYLHHFGVGLPGFICLAAPVWPDAATYLINGLFPGLFSAKAVN